MTNDKNDTAIFLGMLADCPTALLIAELERRRYVVVEVRDDAPLPFEWTVEDEGEALSA